MKDGTKPNTIAIIILSVLLFSILFIGCKTHTVYLPVENTRMKYQDRLLRDSIYHRDSVFLRLKGDTVWFEKYKYLYRDKLVRDSVFITDSIQVPYPVEIEKEINRLTSFQSFQVWCGRLLLLILLVALVAWWIRNKLKF